MGTNTAEANSKLIELMQTTAYFLRGMTFDPAIPMHAKEAMQEYIKDIEAAIDVVTLE